MKVKTPSIPFVFVASLAAFTITASACGLSAVGTGTNLSDEGGIDGAGGKGEADGAAQDDGAGGGGANDGPLLPDGTLPDGALVDPYYGRVTNGLLALYEFEEGSGSTIGDAIPAPYPLNIATLGDVAWHPHSLELTNYTKIAGAGNFDKLMAACKVTNELTVEAWVKYAAVEGDSSTYGRLITVASNGTSRDLALGNIGTKQWWFSMDDGEDANANGTNTNLVHTVLVRTNDGNDTVHGFVNGAEVSSKQGTRKPSTFAAYPLTVGNSPFGGRGVKATIHLIAVYSRALTTVEIGLNYKAGPDPAGP